MTAQMSGLERKVYRMTACNHQEFYMVRSFCAFSIVSNSKTHFLFAKHLYQGGRLLYVIAKCRRLFNFSCVPDSKIYIHNYSALRGIYHCACMRKLYMLSHSRGFQGGDWSPPLISLKRIISTNNTASLHAKWRYYIGF
jgi:hypothetical protein